MIESGNAMGAWKAALDFVLQRGETYVDGKGRKCIEFRNLLVSVNSVQHIDAPIVYLSSFGKWVYPSVGEISNAVLAKDSGGYLYAYGARLFGGINQLDDYIIPLLQDDSTTRRAIIVAWNPVEDASIVSANLPGVISVDFKLRSGFLHVTTVIRSNDMLFGWPANIYQTFVLQKYVAEKLRVRPGIVSTFSSSAHIFGEQRNVIEKILSKSSSL